MTDTCGIMTGSREDLEMARQRIEWQTPSAQSSLIVSMRAAIRTTLTTDC